MANKYANLIGTNLIKDEYTKINTGFDAVETDINTAMIDIANHETAADPHDQYALDTDLATLQTEVTSHKAEDVTDAHGFEYEEGTWTPSIINAASNIRYATYVRIGNLIKLQCTVEVLEEGSDFVIKGLPFSGVSVPSYGSYINYNETLEKQQTMHARIDSQGGGRLGLFYTTSTGSINTTSPPIGVFSIDIIYSIN